MKKIFFCKRKQKKKTQKIVKLTKNCSLYTTKSDKRKRKRNKILLSHKCETEKEINQLDHCK